MGNIAAGGRSIRARLLAAFSPVLLGVGAMGVLGAAGAARMERLSESLTRDEVPRLAALLELSAAAELAAARAESFRLLAAGTSSRAEGDPGAGPKFALLAALERLDEGWARYRRLTPAPSPSASALPAAAEELALAALEVARLRETRAPPRELRAALRRLERSRVQVESRAAGLAEAGLAVLARRGRDAAAASGRTRRALLLGALAVLLTSCALALLSARLIARPLIDLRDVAVAVAAGDFARRADESQGGEAAELAAAFNRMTESLLRSRESQARSEKLSAVGRLAAGVAHEINNPLCVILGFAAELAARARKDDPDIIPLTAIEREARRCRALVQDLLLFSRRGAEEDETFDLAEAVEGAMRLVRSQSVLKGVEVRVENGGRCPVRGRRDRLQQVVLNLCQNALDAMEGGGRLEVRTGLEDGGVALHVRDTGAGIAPELRDRIFEPFFTTKEPGKGTGLGLALVQEIVRQHSGAVEVDSEPGRGTTFTVLLPVQGPAARGEGA